MEFNDTSTKHFSFYSLFILFLNLFFYYFKGRCEYSEPPKSHEQILKRLHSKPSELYQTKNQILTVDDLSDSLDDSSSFTNKKGYLTDVIQRHNSSLSLLSSIGNLTNDHKNLLGNNQFSIFCYNTIEDVVDLLRRQAHLITRLDAEERLKRSGLSLLSSEVNNSNQQIGGGGSVVGGSGDNEVGNHGIDNANGSGTDSRKDSRINPSINKEREKILVEAQKSLSSYSMLNKIIGNEKKKSQNIKKYSSRNEVNIGLTSDNIQFNKKNVNDKNKRNLNQYSAIENDDVGDTKKNDNSYLTCLDMPYRHINVLSTRTNMIHMKIGDHGMMKICDVLSGNIFIQQIILSNARITSIGLQYLTDVLCYLPNLTYLDLSQNAINDEGAESLASSLSNSSIMNERVNLEKVTLMGNRITQSGAISLTNAVLISQVYYLK